MPQSNTRTKPAQLHKNATILVIEDSEDQWQLIQQATQKTFMGIKLVWAANQQQALAYLEDCLTIGLRPPLLILLDLYLPRREIGWQVLEHIRSLPAPLGLLPIVLLSSSGHLEDIAQSYDRGITTYLVKPIDIPAWMDTFQVLKEYWIDTATLPYE